jgi:hypothetical protein
MLEQTLQIFSIRVTDLTDGLEWPLNVNGYVAARDTIDYNRNYLFRRTRDNCQTLTQEVSTITFSVCFYFLCHYIALFLRDDLTILPALPGTSFTSCSHV